MDKDELFEASGLHTIELERKPDGRFFVNGVDVSEYAEATDALIEKFGFKAPHAILMLMEYLASQAAMQDHVFSEKTGEVETFYLSLASRMLGVFYNDFRVKAASLPAGPQDSSEIN